MTVSGERTREAPQSEMSILICNIHLLSNLHVGE